MRRPRSTPTATQVWEVIEEVQTLTINRDAGDGIQEEVVKIKAINGAARIRALELIATHLGMLDRTVKVDIGGKIDIVHKLLEGRARAARGEPAPVTVVSREIADQVRDAGRLLSPLPEDA